MQSFAISLLTAYTEQNATESTSVPVSLAPSLCPSLCLLVFISLYLCIMSALSVCLVCLCLSLCLFVPLTYSRLILHFTLLSVYFNHTPALSCRDTRAERTRTARWKHRERMWWWNTEETQWKMSCNPVCLSYLLQSINSYCSIIVINSNITKVQCI